MPRLMSSLFSFIEELSIIELFVNAAIVLFETIHVNAFPLATFV